MSTIQEARPAAPERAVVTEADVLERAADLLEEFGWRQGGYSDAPTLQPWDSSSTAFCMVGAVGRAGWDLGIAHEQDPWAGERFINNADLLILSVNWNDEPGRTKAEVVARLRGAASHLRFKAQA